jgi:hypothetical protein
MTHRAMAEFRADRGPEKRRGAQIHRSPARNPAEPRDFASL